MEKDEKDIEFEVNGLHKIYTQKELDRKVKSVKDKYEFRLGYGYLKLKTIRKELRLLSRMIACKQTKSEMFRLSEDIKDVYERVGDRL